MERKQPVTRRHFLATAVGVAAGLATAPTAAPAAKIGGNLSYLGFEGDDAPDAAKPFYEKYGVTLGATYLGSTEEVLTKLKAGGRGRYDVGANNTRMIQPMIDQDFLVPLDLEQIPNIKEIYTDFTDPKIVPWAYRDGKLYAIGAYFGFDVINYNADKIPTPPKSWSELLDPKYKGRIGILDSAVGHMLSIGTTIYNYPPDGTKYTKEMLKNVVDWGKKLKANAKTFVKSYGDMTDLLIRGDIWIGFIGWEYNSVQGQKAGVNIKHFLADGPVKAWCDAFVVYKGSSNPDTAHAWINHMIGAEVAAKAAQHTSSLVSNSKGRQYLPKNFADAMGFANLEAQIKRIQWSISPLPQVDNPNNATIDDFKRGWEEIKNA
jgi:putative spermidine/putrescine transport system substrate-binding protein/spermidine/putrescine transport system substrate-binding protein